MSDIIPRVNDLSLLRGDDVPHPGRVGEIQCISFSINILESDTRPIVNMPCIYMTRVELELLPDSAYASVRPSESSRYFSGAGKDMMLDRKLASKQSSYIRHYRSHRYPGSPQLLDIPADAGRRMMCTPEKADCEMSETVT